MFNCLYIRAADEHDRQIRDTSWTSVWTGFPKPFTTGANWFDQSPQCLLQSHTGIFTVLVSRLHTSHHTANSVGSHLIHAGSNIRAWEPPRLTRATNWKPSTVKQVSHQRGLTGRQPRKTPRLQTQHLQAQLKFSAQMSSGKKENVL